MKQLATTATDTPRGLLTTSCVQNSFLLSVVTGWTCSFHGRVTVTWFMRLKNNVGGQNSFVCVERGHEPRIFRLHFRSSLNSHS